MVSMFSVSDLNQLGAREKVDHKIREGCTLEYKKISADVSLSREDLKKFYSLIKKCNIKTEILEIKFCIHRDTTRFYNQTLQFVLRISLFSN